MEGQNTRYISLRPTDEGLRLIKSFIAIFQGRSTKPIGTQPRRRKHARSYWESPSATEQQGFRGRLIQGRFS